MDGLPAAPSGGAGGITPAKGRFRHLRRFEEREGGQMKRKKWLSLCLAAGVALGSLFPAGTAGGVLKKTVQSAPKTIAIDGNDKRSGENSAFRGLGAVTCNNSSRLLLDYKEKNPEQYWEIMNWLFHPETGAGLSHIKIELGCDLDTSSGAEPATKRTEYEPANVKRGAGYLFAHDALSINPDITVDMLCWGMPAWVENAYEKSNSAGNKARYKWYKETLDAAYDDWGIRFSYISANRNERDLEIAWTKYLRKALDNETAGRYSYKEIKLVAADETDNMYAASAMLKDAGYRNAVDVLGFHYNSYMDKNVKKLHDKYNKEIWFSEGASVATDSIFGANNTTDGQTTSGTNGMLDIANRIIIAMAQSDMTMYEFQPAAAAYYDGAVYYPKQLVSANHPWSGFYRNTNGLVMAMHFTNFIKKGWSFINSASFGDGKQSDHCITETNDDYLTAMSNTTGDYSTVITNDSKTERTYQIQVANTEKAFAPVSVWETKTSGAGESYDANWLKKINTILPENIGGTATYSITIAPYSMVTLTTTEGQSDYAERKAASGVDNPEQNTRLSLPYSDGFEYGDEFIERRGGTPLYTNDKNGAFEVVAEEDGSHVLRQQLYKEITGNGWAALSDPVTSLGDDTWKDYVVSVDVRMDGDAMKNNYAAVGARFNMTANENNGFWLRLYRDGRWALYGNGDTLAKSKTKLKGVAPGRWNNLKLRVQGNSVSAYINHVQVAKKTMAASCVNSGRVALGSAFCRNAFDNLKVQPISGGVSYIDRVDDFDSRIQYRGSVERLQSQSYMNYGRTISRMSKKGDTLSYTFTGTGIAFLGVNSAGTKILVSIDNAEAEAVTLKDVSPRCTFYSKTGLAYGLHTVQMTLNKKAELEVDALEISGEAAGASVPAESASIENTEIALQYGQKAALQAAVVPETALADGYYTTSDASVAVVLSDGTVVANGAGTAQVALHTSNGMTAAANVTVTELAITPGTGIFVLGAGQEIKLKAAFRKGGSGTAAISWQTSDKTVASVSSSGKVTALKEGEATVTATAGDGYRRSALIRVLKAPYKISVRKKLSMKKGAKKQLHAKAPAGCGGGGDFKYRSSRKSVASVSSSGKITAKKKGRTTITVTAYNGKKVQIKVTVKKAAKKKSKK